MSQGSNAGIAVINRYPVKSMLGEQLERAVVGTDGVVGDRAYAVIDTADGKVASAKNPAKWRTLLACRAEFVTEPEPGSDPPVAVMTMPDGRQVLTDDPAVDAVLSEVLGRSVRLASTAGGGGTATERPLLDEVWPDVEGLAPDEFVENTAIGANAAGETVSEIPMALLASPGTFFDVSALHLLTTATLARLHELEPRGTFDARRYRPNFLVDIRGAGFVENDWVGETVTIGAEVQASVLLPTMRCVMTTLAHEDLPVDRVTLRTIARNNRLEIENFGTWACAGVYASVTAGGHVAVGDQVTLSAR